MSENVISIAKRSAKALDDGQISQEAYAKLQERLAQEMFPTDSMGVALAKFYATPHGAEMLNRGLRKSHADMQKAGALGAYEPVAKADGNPTPAWTPTSAGQSEYETPPHPMADDTPRVFEAAVELLMKERNCGRDAAISEIYRAEKRRKGLSY
ncbi:MAG: hypothetical protein ACLQF4_19600 [Xanthobacteraceae bacterium]